MTYSSPQVTYNIYKDDLLIESDLENFEYLDSNIESGSTYTYNVSAVYPNGDESPLSENFTITIEECDIDNPGCDCDTCNSENCIFDCSLNCIDLLVESETIFGYYRDNNNCEDGEDGEINLDCIELGDGLDCIVDLSIDNDLIPKVFLLGQNTPNPFNPITSIPFAIPEISDVELTIYNILGQQVYKKYYKNLYPGNYQHHWDGTAFNSGLYIYTLQTSSGVYLKEKMLLIK